MNGAGNKKYMMIKEKKVVDVADVGTYEIEVTSVVNTKTLNVNSLLSLMSHSNMVAPPTKK